MNTSIAYPRFPTIAEDTYHIFSLLELAGDKHYKFITDFCYLYSGSPPNPKRNCDQRHQQLDDYKSRIKTPLKTLNSLDEEAQQLTEFTILNLTAYYYNIFIAEYQICMKKL